MELTNDKINTLSKREIERQLNIQKRKNDKCLITADSEKLDIFQSIFNEKQDYIKSSINKSYNIPIEDLPNHFNTISKEILTLQKYVAASIIFLRNYDIQKCHEFIQELTLEARNLEIKLLPKKKFGFKNKLKQKNVENKLNGHDVLDGIDTTKKINEDRLKENLYGYSDKIDEQLVLKSDATYKKDIAIERLQNCIVKLFGTPSTLHLDTLSNCKIYCGPVSTSIFAENCHNCLLVIACQQLRLHSSQNVHIYLHVTSRAIMEDCTNIFIAPYNWSYNGIKNDFQASKLDTQNNWKCIDDFNWLNTEKHSPNWHEISEEDRLDNTNA